MADQQLTPLIPKNDSFISKQMIGRVIDYWYLFLLSLVVCLSLAWLKVYYATPMYKVSSQILIEDTKGGNQQALSGSSGGVDFSSLFSSKINLQNEIGILQTTDLCQQVVDKMQLYISYFHNGKVRAVELYKSAPFQVSYHSDSAFVIPITMNLSFPKAKSNNFTITVGKKSFVWRFNDTLIYNRASFYFTRTNTPFDPEATYLFQVQDPHAVAAGVAANLITEFYIQKSTILKLTYNTSLPQKGMDVLYGIIQAYIDRNQDMKNRMSDSALSFINERIGLVGNDLSNIESTIQKFKQDNKITDLSSQSQQLVSSSGDYTQKQSDLAVQLQVIKSMLSYVENEQNNSRPVPSLLNADATFSGLVSAYNQAQVQRDRSLLSLKEDNPIFSNLDKQLAGLRGDIIRSLKSQQQALSISLQQLNSQNNALNGIIRNVPAQERRFLDYSREQSVKEALYLFLLQKKEETAIAKASNVPNTSIIESPETNFAPYEPDKNQTLIVGLIIGLLLPSAFVALRLLLNNKVQSREDISRHTNVTVLSDIGHSSTQDLLNIKDEGRSIIAEQFRIFRTNMDFALPNIHSPVILITSCVSGEGKSFIAANLGQIYAISGKKVLLMELDLRRPKLSKMLQVDNSSGFSNYIISNRPINDFIQTVHTENLKFHLLPSGPIPPNPAELLLSGKMEELMKELRQQFDIIIIDTAPIGAVTDAQVIGKYADISLYLVRQGYSVKDSVEIVNDILVNKKLPSLYIIFNDIKAGTSYKYGYGYRYSYGYGYQYIDSVKKKKWWQRKMQ